MYHVNFYEHAHIYLCMFFRYVYIYEIEIISETDLK